MAYCLQPTSYNLPAAFLYSRYFSAIGALPETNAAQTKISHISSLATAKKAAAHDARFEFRLF